MKKGLESLFIIVTLLPLVRRPEKSVVHIF
jgi:hypothetical protein